MYSTERSQMSVSEKWIEGVEWTQFVWYWNNHWIGDMIWVHIKQQSVCFSSTWNKLLKPTKSLLQVPLTMPMFPRISMANVHVHQESHPSGNFCQVKIPHWEQLVDLCWLIYNLSLMTNCCPPTTAHQMRDLPEVNFQFPEKGRFYCQRWKLWNSSPS